MLRAAYPSLHSASTCPELLPLHLLRHDTPHHTLLGGVSCSCLNGHMFPPQVLTISGPRSPQLGVCPAYLCDSCCESGLAMVDMSNGANIHMWLGACVDVIAAVRTHCSLQPGRLPCGLPAAETAVRLCGANM
jgi:hypothetical protein